MDESEAPSDGGGANQIGIESQTGVDEEEELKMKIVLYYHTLVSFDKKVRMILSLTTVSCIYSFKASFRNGLCSCNSKTIKSSPNINTST